MRLRVSALLTLVIASSATAQTYTIQTFAGGALPVNIGGKSASLGSIYGIAADRTGNVFLSLGDYDLVLRLDAATGNLTRVAGNGTRGFSGDGGPATGAQLSSPAGLAIDAAGNLYLADANNLRVREVASGAIATVAGSGVQGYDGDGGAATRATFNGLAGVAVDRDGNVYVADFFSDVVRKISGGTITTVAGNGTYGYNGDNIAATSAQLAGPTGIALDAAGNLYIADVFNNRVRKVSNGIITTVAGNGTAGFTGDKGPAANATLRQPADVALDAAGNLFIADYGNNRIRMVANGVITTSAGNGTQIFSGDGGSAASAGLAAPQRIAFDAADNLYLVDGVRVRKIAGGVIATVAGGGAPLGEGGPAASTQLQSPQGVAVDAAGNVYITDAGTGRVLEVSNGTLLKLAGTGTAGFSGDNGPAANAQLAGPSGVAVDSAGSIYVTDGNNLRVRKIAGGTITTFAGGGSTLGDNGPAAKAQLSAPEGLAADGAGNLYIADLNRVRMVSDGVIGTAAGNGSVGYQGDGGVATAARISGASGVAAASGNLYIADSGNNRVRMVANGVITTVAGNGNYGFSGTGGTATSATLGNPTGVAADPSGDFYITDSYRVLKVSKGKITTIAGLTGPQGVAVDGVGNVYVADPAGHRVRVLTPAGTACAVASTPATLQIASTGGALAVNIGTGANCPWAIENLPDWIAVNGDLFGTGAASATLVIAANPDMPRSGTLVVGGQNVTVAQAGAATIVGQVTLRTATGAAVAGVTIGLTGTVTAQVTTDAGGNYAISNLNSTGTYTVTPVLAGYSFVPVSQTFTNTTTNPTANFTAWPVPRIAALAPAFASVLQPPAASLAAGEIVTLFGTNLCIDPAASAVPTLPDRIGACIVQVDGVNIRLYYGSSSQINAVLPQALALGTHQMVVQRYTDTGYKQLAAQSQMFPFTVDRVGMAFVEWKDVAATIVAAQYTDGGLAGSSRPLRARRHDRPVPDGAGAQGADVHRRRGAEDHLRGGGDDSDRRARAGREGAVCRGAIAVSGAGPDHRAAPGLHTPGGEEDGHHPDQRAIDRADVELRGQFELGPGLVQLPDEVFGGGDLLGGPGDRHGLLRVVVVDSLRTRGAQLVDDPLYVLRRLVVRQVEDAYRFHDCGGHLDFASARVRRRRDQRTVELLDEPVGQRNLVGRTARHQEFQRIVGEDALHIRHGADQVDEFLQLRRRLHVSQAEDPHHLVLAATVGVWMGGGGRTRRGALIQL